MAGTTRDAVDSYFENETGKFLFIDTAGMRPPHFVFFCNDSKLFHFSYQRYLENQVRATFGLEGTPIRLTVRQRGDKEE